MERIIVDDNVSAFYALKMKERLDAIEQGGGTDSVEALSNEDFAQGSVIETVGVPTYVSDVSEYSAYNLTDTGWYVFARISAPEGTKVTAGTTVTGCAGHIATVGAEYIDIAVRFEVAAMTQKVSINWGETTKHYYFKATDLAIRNLDYRTTFYVYDLAPYATWSYALTTDTTFAADKNYYVKSGNSYSLAEVSTVAYVLTSDATFQSNKTYYTVDPLSEEVTYVAATVTAGDAVTENTYFEQTTVPVPAYYEHSYRYTLTSDATFQENVAYYTESEGEYSEATVTTGESVTADTYYVRSDVYTQSEDDEFHDGKTYYIKTSDSTYSEAVVTVGESVPAYYNHSKLTISGMARNITYQFNEIIDCPSEFVLPAIEDDGYGAWFEFRMRHAGSYSSTLVPLDTSVKIATEHTQAETAGFNMIDLHYMNIDNTKIWRFMNTHSSIPS